jgi:hypothetical protein
MAIDYKELQKELINDPLGLDYKKYIDVGNDVFLAAILNSKDGPGSQIIQINYLSKNDFLAGMTPAALRLSGKDDPTQRKWDRILGFAQSLDPINLIRPQVQALFQNAINEGLLTQAEIDTFSKKRGSRAEVLFGEGSHITHTDIAIALRGNNGESD